MASRSHGNNTSQHQPSQQHPSGLDSLGRLNDSLPSGRQRQQLAKDQHQQAFRGAALSLTSLFKAGQKAADDAYLAGKREALQDVLEFIQASLDHPLPSTSSGSPNLTSPTGQVGQIGRLIDYICARQETLQAEEDDSSSSLEDDNAPPSAPIPTSKPSSSSSSSSRRPPSQSQSQSQQATPRSRPPPPTSSSTTSTSNNASETPLSSYRTTIPPSSSSSSLHNHNPPPSSSPNHPKRFQLRRTTSNSGERDLITPSVNLSSSLPSSSSHTPLGTSTNNTGLKRRWAPPPQTEVINMEEFDFGSISAFGEGQRVEEDETMGEGTAWDLESGDGGRATKRALRRS